MFYLLIVGSRTFNDFDLMVSKCDKLLANQSEVCVVSGGARGADTLAERYAKLRGYSLKVFPADWSKGRSAGYTRNREMYNFISNFQKRGVVAFWDGTSHGTAHSIKLAQEFNTPLRIIKF